MRINKYIALATGLSRRAADAAIAQGSVTVNGMVAGMGQDVTDKDQVTLNSKPVQPPAHTATIILHKPTGYVVSRLGQGSKTIYELLPPEFHTLKPVGRLDKDSSGLLLMTNNGALANQLTHPRYAKTKIYDVMLNKPLAPLHKQMIIDYGVQLEDGLSSFQLTKRSDDRQWRVTMQEGRNRQIRRTFAALGYTVIKLHRTRFGNYQLNDIKSGSWQKVTENEIL
ncbi:MAG TPA: pseudouridine synthase [Candidatus Saccharimonadales bacterium]|nr:pseudouridine synthase [Candidatus Saccharimonadales bacterium]